jgi:hypothetical protein
MIKGMSIANKIQAIKYLEANLALWESGDVFSFIREVTTSASQSLVNRSFWKKIFSKTNATFGI